MKILTLIVIGLLSFVHVYAQEINLDPKILKVLENPVEVSAEKCEEPETQKRLECSCEKPADVSITTFEFDSKKDVPKKFRDLPSIKSIQDNDHITIFLTEINDNLNAAPLSFLVGTLTKKRIDGNDYGRTHGMDIRIAHRNSKDITYTFGAYTELYTKPLPSAIKGHNDILFTEDDVISLTRDNKAKKKMVYSSVGVGWQILNSDKPIAGGATSQQSAFHSLAKAKNHRSYAYLSDGEPIRSGPFLEMALGLHKIMATGGKCTITPQLEVGTHVSSVTESNTAWAEIKLTGAIEGQNQRVEGGASLKLIGHADGVEVDQILFVNYRLKNWGVKSSVEFPSEDLKNNVKYNNDGDPIAKLTIYKSLSKKK
jgi:hypothetical protein